MRRAHQLGKLYHNCRHEVRRHDSAWGDGAEVVVRAIARPQLRFRASIWSPTPNNCCTPSLGLHKAFLNEPTSAGRDLVAFPGASDNAARHAREWEPNRALIHLEQRLELRKTQSVFFDLARGSASNDRAEMRFAGFVRRRVQSVCAPPPLEQRHMPLDEEGCRVRMLQASSH